MEIPVALLAEGVDRNNYAQTFYGLRLKSPSSRRAWIEISQESRKAAYVPCVALLAEGVDRNIVGLMCYIQCSLSPSSRRAWIEISASTSSSQASNVALLAEGVDRNWSDKAFCISRLVALLAEGVDRNIRSRKYHASLTPSPSSRRAWIEIR